jgi:hypothetical protein
LASSSFGSKQLPALVVLACDPAHSGNVLVLVHVLVLELVRWNTVWSLRTLLAAVITGGVFRGGWAAGPRPRGRAPGWVGRTRPPGRLGGFVLSRESSVVW